MLSQDEIDWLTNNVHNVLSPSMQKPTFIKMYGKTKPDTIWYKSVKNNQDGSEILIPAKPEEIKLWNLK